MSALDQCDALLNTRYTLVGSIPPENSALYVRNTYSQPGCSASSLIQQEQISNTCLHDPVLGYQRVVSCAQGLYVVALTVHNFALDSTCTGNFTESTVQQLGACQRVANGPTYTQVVCTMPYSAGSPTIAPAHVPTGVPSGTPTSEPTFAPCVHSICLTGAALRAACHPCAAQVISWDAACGINQWDSVCVYEVFSLCGVDCADSSPAWLPVRAPKPVKVPTSTSISPTSAPSVFLSYTTQQSK
jgi:hypothetical protein